MVEEGGKALAAYLKPREEGKSRRDSATEFADVVKTLGPRCRILARRPARAVQLQATLGKAYLDLWAAGAKRLSGETTEPLVKPDPRDRRFTDPEWSSNPFFDFLKQAYLLTRVGEPHGRGRRGPRRRRRA